MRIRSTGEITISNMTSIIMAKHMNAAGIKPRPSMLLSRPVTSNSATPHSMNSRKMVG